MFILKIGLLLKSIVEPSPNAPYTCEKIEKSLYAPFQGSLPPQSITYLYNKYLLSTYYTLGAFLSTESPSGTTSHLCSWKLHSIANLMFW